MHLTPLVDLDYPQHSLDEALYKLSFIAEALNQPIHDNETFSLSEDAQIGLSYFFREVQVQLRSSADALLAKLNKKEA